MEYPKRKRPRLKEYDYSQNGIYFITICTKDRRPLLGTVLVGAEIQDEADLGMGQIKLSNMGAICCEVLAAIPDHYTGVAVDSYIIMPDHIHMLLQLDGPSGGQGSGRPTIKRIMHAFKRISAARAGAALWQDSFYEHIVRNETDLREIQNYIHRNPYRWALENGKLPSGGQGSGRPTV